MDFLFDSISPDLHLSLYFDILSSKLLVPTYLVADLSSSGSVSSPLASPISILDILIVKTMHLVLFWKGGRVWELLSMYSIGLLYYTLSCQCSWHLPVTINSVRINLYTRGYLVEEEKQKKQKAVSVSETTRKGCRINLRRIFSVVFWMTMAV